MGNSVFFFSFYLVEGKLDEVVGFVFDCSQF